MEVENLSNKKKCECCNVEFRQTRDYDNHIKTQKHIKKMLCIDSFKCPYCDYHPDDKTNMPRHINTVHKIIMKEAKTKIASIKKVKPEVNVNDNVAKMYLGIREARDKIYWGVLGLRSKYKRNINHLWKPDEELMIKLKNEIKSKVDEYNNLKKQTHELEDKFPFLKELIVPVKPICDEDDESSDDEELKKKQLIEAEKKAKQEDEASKNKWEEVNKLNDKLDKLRQDYIVSRGDITIKSLIENTEKEVVKLMKC